MFKEMKSFLENELKEIKDTGLYKSERLITSPQKAQIEVNHKQKVLNMCANNYLGLSSDAQVIEASHKTLDAYGYGLSSVRFICGTQDIHKTLENKISEFLEMEDTILYSSCFDANTGLFETLLTNEDAIISDALNHASIIDGVRLCKAKRFRYDNNDMDSLEEKLKESQDARFRLIATDGVFSMDGTIANLKGVCDLAEKYNALVMVDDSHAVGFVGKNGKGSHEYNDVMGRVDIITGTLGKALGGASGGYVSAKKEIVEILRQRSRPYLFSNSLAPMIVGTSLKVLDLLMKYTNKRDQLEKNANYFRKALIEKGFDVPEGDHPIVPIMLGEARIAQEMADLLLKKGIYVIGFFYPVVPKGKARIRVQVSAGHSIEDLQMAVEKFVEAKLELGI